MHYILAVNEVEEKNKIKFPTKFREDIMPNVMAACLQTCRHNK